MVTGAVSLLVTVVMLAAIWKLAVMRARGEKSAVKDIAMAIVLVALTIVAVGVSMTHVDVRVLGVIGVLGVVGSVLYFRKA